MTVEAITRRGYRHVAGVSGPGAPLAMATAPKHAVVVGTGGTTAMLIAVLGLTSALELRKRGYHVTMIGRELPHDIYSQGFASPWAGANWISFAKTNEKERRRDRITYQKFQELSKELPEDVLAFMPFQCFDEKDNDFDTYWFGDLCGGVSKVDSTPVQSSAPYLYEFRSLGLNVPRYTIWLVKRLSEEHKDVRGPPVRMLRGYVPSLAAAAAYVPEAALVVNATGIGSQSLQDVQDEHVFPIRGQTVLINAPKYRDEKYARCFSKITPHGVMYIIPRARSGQVILGGSFDRHVSNPLLPDAEVTSRIMQECTALSPDLLPDHVDTKDPDAWKSLDVIRVNIGVRPAREGGARVELGKPLERNGTEVGVIHAYGIGYQASYGIAAEVGTLADQCSAPGPAAKL